jgi:polysaccharide biosynthesis/export protein
MMPRALAGMVVALALALGVALPAAGQGPAAAVPRVEGSGSRTAAEGFRIGPADVLQISVWKNEALTQEVPVRPDGMISFPLVNEVHAAGLTPMQLRDLLKKKLEPFVSRPEVSVVVLEIHSFAVSVLGEVKTAGRYELKNPATILDVLALAGGITEYASPSRIFVLRSSGGAVKRIPFDYERFTAASRTKASGNIYVQPDDIIVVP